MLPSTGEATLGVVNDKPTFVPGIATDFAVQNVPGLVSRAVRETSSGSTFTGTIDGPLSTYRYIAAPISVAGSSDRAVFITVVDINAKLADLTNAFATFWEMVAAAVLIIASLGWYLSGRLLRPLTDLRTTVERITSDNRAGRIPITGNDDLSALGESVNGMLDRLDSAMTTQRHLLDDVRHELNTPVTIVRGHLELLDATDTAEVESTRALAIEELDRVSMLVQDLALLAESEQLDPQRTVVDVAELTQAVFDKVRVLPGHIWVLSTVGPGTMAIDRDRMTQAWLQLVDNASKYSPVGSEIAIGSSGDSDRVELWVVNVGPKIPENVRARIFERFGRGDTGRGIRGSGLGLAIVSAIAAAHSGFVTLSSTDDHTRFGIRVPRLAAFSRAAEEGEHQ